MGEATIRRVLAPLPGDGQHYTIDQSPTLAQLEAKRPKADVSAGIGAEDVQGRADGLCTLSIQLVRGRNLGMVGGRLLNVQVERDVDGTIGIGLDTDDHIVEVTNDKQLSLQVRDQIRAVNGVVLGDGNIVTAMRQVASDVKTFPVELIRWPKGTPLPCWDVFAVVETVAFGGPDSHLGARRLDRVETELRDSRSATFSVNSIVTLYPANSHELRLRLFREGALRPSLIGEAVLDLAAYSLEEGPSVAWVPLLDAANKRAIVGEFLLRIARCDWATRLGTSPDTGHNERVLPRVGASLLRAPIHQPQPLARISDVPLSGVS